MSASDPSATAVLDRPAATLQTASQTVPSALARARAREQAAEDRLRALDETKAAFLTAAAHQLRTPTTVMVGMTDLIGKRGTELPPETLTELAQSLAGHARRLGRLVEDLTALDTSSGCMAPFEPEAIDVGGLARRVVIEHGHNGSVTVDAASVHAEVDAAKVARIVANLLDNARRYAPGAPVTLTVEAGPAARTVVVRVADQGPGIPPDQRDEVFRPFHQGPHVSAHDPGTGIGLAVVRRYARLHGGDALIEATPGGGTTAVVRLPTEVGA